MNVTSSMFPSTAGAGADAPPGAQGASGAGSESVSGQAVGNTNPFALLLGGQLRTAAELGTRKDLAITLADGKMPTQPAQLLPQNGKALPDAEAGKATDQANADSDPQMDKSDSSPLAPLELSAILKLPQGDAADPSQQSAQNVNADWTLNLLQLAMGETDDGNLHKLSLDRDKQSGDDQAILRVLQGAGLRADVDRAGVLLQHAGASPPQPTRDSGDQTGSSQTAALTADPGLKAAADTQSKVAPAVQSTLQQPVGKQGWDQELGSRMVWMSKQDLQSAQLRLNPAHLGPLEVRLSVQQDQTATVTFLSNHAPVRDAVEAAIPRLREMLADNGVNLGGVDVSAHSHGQARDQQPFANNWLSQADGSLDGTGTEDVVRSIALGMVDYFA